MKRIFVAVKQRTSDGSITPIFDWFVLECGHLVSRHRSVAPDPKKMYCSKCTRTAKLAESIRASELQWVQGRADDKEPIDFVGLGKVPEILDRMADAVLAYRPKPKSKAAKKRRCKATKKAKG